MNHKMKIVMISICASLILCFLSLGLSLRSICVHTLSEANINPNIANRIVDIVFDNFTGLTNSQLLDIQNDIKKSQSLYKVNGDYFDHAVGYILNDKKIDVKQDDIDEFIGDVIDIIEENLGQSLSQDEKENLKQQLKEKIDFDSIYSTIIENLKTSLSIKGKFIIKLYQIMTSLVYKIVLVVFLIFILYELSKYSQHRLFAFFVSIIFIMASLLNYFIVFIINQLSSFLSMRLIGQSIIIQLDQLIVIAIIYLTIGIVQALYAYYQYNKYNEKS